MKRWRSITAAAAFVGLAVFMLVAWAVMVTSLRTPVSTAKRPDTGENARRERRPQFGPDESRPIQYTHVEKTRKELLAELGEPTREGPWPIGFPSDEKFEKYKGLRTLEWHWESGRFLALVYPIDGRWICFNSIWVPKGVVID